jgi:hypothetical protein
MIIALPSSFVDLPALVLLPPDKFTPSGADINVHQAQHETRLARTRLVEPPFGAMIAGRRRPSAITT